MKNKYLLFLIIVSILFGTCARNNNYTRKSFLYTDISRIEQNIEIDPDTVISLYPEITDIIILLGSGNELIGVTSQCIKSKQGENLEILGNYKTPDINKIIELNPDIVFCDGVFQNNIFNELRNRGIKVVCFHSTDYYSLIRNIKVLGKIFNKNKKAKKINNSMEKKLKLVRHRVNILPLLERKKVLLEIWNMPLIIAGEASYTGDVIKQAGLINVAYDVKKEFQQLDPKKLKSRQIDYIIIAHTNSLPENVRVELEKEIIVKQSNFIYVNPDYILKAVPVSIDTITELYKMFYDNGN